MGPKPVSIDTEDLDQQCGSLRISRISHQESSTSSSFNDRKSSLMSEQMRPNIICPRQYSIGNITIKSSNMVTVKSSRRQKSIDSNPKFDFVIRKFFQQRQRVVDWVQCAGHNGTIIPSTDCTILKKRDCNDYETGAYMKLQNDICSQFVPKFHHEIQLDEQTYIEMEDLTKRFTKPAIMDLKLGTRTFLECEVKNTTKRRDLYEKMIALDPNEPTEEEHSIQAITKLRYMQFREKESSTSSLGFRVEAVKSRHAKELNKDFKKIKTKPQIVEVMKQFLGPENELVRQTLVRRLKCIREKIETSPFFKTHEIIGSSVLIIYDGRLASAWLIDFAKAIPLPTGLQVTHRSPWQLNNHEDGYLTGLDNIISILESDKLKH